jgi:hypothetical protein
MKAHDWRGGSGDAEGAIPERTDAGKVENDLACLPATGYDSPERKTELTTETQRHREDK